MEHDCTGVAVTPLLLLLLLLMLPVDYIQGYWTRICHDFVHHLRNFSCFCRWYAVGSNAAPPRRPVLPVDLDLPLNICKDIVEKEKMRTKKKKKGGKKQTNEWMNEWMREEIRLLPRLEAVGQWPTSDTPRNITTSAVYATNLTGNDKVK